MSSVMQFSFNAVELCVVTINEKFWTRLKARLSAKKSDGTALTLTTQEDIIKKTYNKRFAISLGFDFFKHPVYPYGLKEDLSITIELNSAKEVILCTGDTNAVYQISDII